MEVFSKESKCTVKISGSDIYDQAEIHFDMVLPSKYGAQHNYPSDVGGVKLNIGR